MPAPVVSRDERHDQVLVVGRADRRQRRAERRCEVHEPRIDADDELGARDESGERVERLLRQNARCRLASGQATVNELAAPFAENTATSSAIPNMPPRKRAMLKTPDALPISTTLTEPSTAF